MAAAPAPGGTRVMRLEGKTALVTGSSSGIGEAIALRFAREGADVAVHYHREEDSARAVVAQIQGLGRRAVALGADTGVMAEAAGLVTSATAALGRLDILVNNAGVEIREPFLEVSEEHYDLVLDVNLKGAFFAAQAAARHMVQRGGGGRIINLSSIHEDVAFLHYATYTTSKGGLRMLTRTVCQELAPHGITVNDIAPGAIATPINRRTLGDGDLLQELQGVIPAGRLGEPDEVATLAVFLASDEAAYITGATYVIDGGMTHFNKGL
jgi:glucose 1-dehydrogenase